VPKRTKETAKTSPSRPSVIVTAAEAAGRTLGRAVGTAMTAVGGVVAYATPRKPKATPAKARSGTASKKKDTASKTTASIETATPEKPR
jgi:hypothetical protein